MGLYDIWTSPQVQNAYENYNPWWPQDYGGGGGGSETSNLNVPTYRCPSQPYSSLYIDASSGLYPGYLPWGNYAANYRVFGNYSSPPMCGGGPAFPPNPNPTYLWCSPNVEGSARLPESFPDGTSNTIMFTERWATVSSVTVTDTTSAALSWTQGYAGQRASFCDGVNVEYGIIPTAPSTPVANYPCPTCTSSPPPAVCPLFTSYTATFQVAQQVSTSGLTASQFQYWFLPNSLHVGGIPVAMADGSVRFCSESMSATTWGYACDPLSGHPLGSDW